jgi:hypothetical protein
VHELGTVKYYVIGTAAKVIVLGEPVYLYTFIEDGMPTPVKTYVDADSQVDDKH